MKKLSLIIITVFLTVGSYAQSWNVCNHPCAPPAGAMCPNECWEMTIYNQIDCDLDFWFDYTLTAPCGDIVPAFNPAGNFLARQSGPKTFNAYELTWPCGDNPPVCACPSHFKFRLGHQVIAALDPFVIEPWPILTSFGVGSNITYVTTLTCTGLPIKIQVIVTAPGKCTIYFKY